MRSLILFKYTYKFVFMQSAFFNPSLNGSWFL